MHTNFKELESKMLPESREKVKSKTKILLMEMRIAELEEALREADNALSSWFSSEYCESKVAKKVRSVLYKR